MTLVVAYDIKDDRIRARLARHLKKKGIRLQKSVFAVEVERHQFKRFLAGIKKITDEQDNIAVFRLCQGCKKNAIQSKKAEPFYYIF